ncbi:hypothetical protein ACFL2H_08360 [Planctomycetota bacterium]
MWSCPNCKQSNEDSFGTCRNCSSSKSGDPDDRFQGADDVSIDTLQDPIKQLDAVQKELARRSFRPWSLRRICLQFARVISVLGCVGIVIGFLFSVGTMPDGTSALLYFAACVCSFVYSAAMYFVFSHVLAAE